MRRGYVLKVSDPATASPLASATKNGAGGEAAGASRPGLQVIAALSEPVEDLAVPSGQCHLQLRSRLRHGLVEDSVHQTSSSADREMAWLHVEVGVDEMSSVGPDPGFGQEASLLLDHDVLGVAGQEDLPGSWLYGGVDDG